MILGPSHRALVGIGEHDAKILAVPAAPGRRIENVRGAYRRGPAGNETGPHPLAVAAIRRPWPIGRDRIVPITDLDHVGIYAVAIGTLLDLVLEGKPTYKILR